MTKQKAIRLFSFIENHFDMISQEEWFDFCEMVFDVVVRDATMQGYIEELVKRFPSFFVVN